MIYIKRYNEELRPYIYRQAGEKLTKLGHPKRGEKLSKWGDFMQDFNDNKIANDRLENGIKMGEYEIGLWNSKIKNDAPVITGNFYLFLSIHVDAIRQRYEYWRSGEDQLWLEILMGIIPADSETWSTLSEYIQPDQMQYNTYFVNDIQLNISDSFDAEYVEDPTFEPDGTFGFSPTHESPYTAFFMNRADAVKFRKILIDIFEGRIVINPTNEHPGGDKEWLLDELCSEKDRTLEEFESIINSIKKVNVNKMYKD